MSAETFKCAACGHTVAPARDAGQPHCPQCGAPLPPALPKTNLKWWWLVIALLVPPVVTLLCALGKMEGPAVLVPLVGGGGAGIFCGVMLGRHVGRTSGTRLLLGVVFTGLFGLASFILSFCGCLAGGFAMNLH